MAWTVIGHNLTMVEGDYGIELPITISGLTMTENDSIKITFKDRKNGETVLAKDYSNVQENTIILELTEQESALFPVGGYVYSLDWYQSGNFLCNIIAVASLKVVDKA